MADVNEVCQRYVDCFVESHGDQLVLGNSVLRRVYRWNNGDVTGSALEGAGKWTLRGDAPDADFPGEAKTVSDGRVEATVRPENAQTPAHLEVNLYHTRGRLEIRRRFRLYPDTPVIACDYFLRGVSAAAWASAAADAGRLSQIEHAKAAAEGRVVAPVQIDCLQLDTHHLHLGNVQFFDITDRRNNLIQETSHTPYLQSLELRGQLLLVRDLFSSRRLFVLKESPCSDIQLANPGCDFSCQRGDIRVYGIGLTTDDIPADRWVRGYGVVIGVADSDIGLLQALRRYQHQIRRWLPGRDHMILQNTWGDRGQDRKVGEAFALAEIAAARRLGVTHFQLDDGWQRGRSANSAFGGTLDGIWQQEGYWSVHPEKFPRGLEPVQRAARQAGIELCLWFNPSKDDSYAHWEQDAACLIDLYKRYGIRTFKIDGVDIPDKRADINLRALLDTVMTATEGQAVFNLDVTAGRRFGYHYFGEYGNKFLENRYTDWSNYYPHWTLRNLWQLARYVPPQSLQIEFLNCWRNPDKYPADDPLAPRNVPFAYCFGVTMMAQPLAWFEGTGLPEAAFAIAPLVKAYRALQPAIHAGHILPLGDEPDGTRWTGLQSLLKDEGYFAVYREHHPETRAKIRVLDLDGKKLRVRRVLGEGRCRGRTVSAAGELTFEMPRPFSFGLFHYRVVDT